MVFFYIVVRKTNFHKAGNPHRLCETQGVLWHFSLDDAGTPGFQSTGSGGSTSVCPDISDRSCQAFSFTEVTTADAFFTVHGVVTLGYSQRFNRSHENVCEKVYVSAA